MSDCEVVELLEKARSRMTAQERDDATPAAVRVKSGLASTRIVEVIMPERKTIERAQRDKREGKAPSTQAGEFVREEIEHVREGKHGARSTAQAIAIGLSKARRAGVDLPPPKKGKTSEKTRRGAERDLEAGDKPAAKPSPKRSRATTRALEREGSAAASKPALARQAKAAASQRSAGERSAAAQKAVRTKGPAERSAAARKAARTRRATGPPSPWRRNSCDPRRYTPEDLMAIESINPATGERLKTHEEMTRAAVGDVVVKAHEAYAAWRQTSFGERAARMRQAAQILRARADDFARLMAQEMGKPVRDGVAEAQKCALGCDFYADNAERLLAREPVQTEARSSFVTFNPIGVVLAVMPWNFPFWQVFRFAAPALMAGNAGGAEARVERAGLCAGDRADLSRGGLSAATCFAR